MNCGIYLIRNTINGKVYVGSSKDLKARWQEHSWNLLTGKHDNDYLVKSWKKYRNHFLPFVFEVVEHCVEEDLLAREDWWITLLDSMNEERGYNLISAYRRVISQRTKDKIAASLIGNTPWNKGRKGLQAAWNKGVSPSPEQIEKQRAALTGRKNGPPSPETRAKIAEKLKGNTNGRGKAGKTYRQVPHLHRGKPWTEARRAAETQRQSRRRTPTRPPLEEAWPREEVILPEGAQQ